MSCKVCSKCKIEKPIEDFYLRRRSGKYRMCRCITCHREDQKYRSYKRDPIKSRLSGKLYYQRHPEKIKYKTQLTRERLQQRMIDGLCTACPTQSLPNERVCLFCWMMILIRTLCTRSRTKMSLPERKQLAKQLLPTIPTHCPYTSEPLTPGINLHMDHKIPLKVRPDLAFSLDNLQWVSKAYNYAKWDLTDEEFQSKYSLRYIGH